MLDLRVGVGILLCLIGMGATIWIFWGPLKIIPRAHARSWPWIGMALLVIEICIPAYLLDAKFDEQKKQNSAANAGISLDCRPAPPPIKTAPFAEVLTMNMNDGDIAGNVGPIGLGEGLKTDKDGLFLPDLTARTSSIWKCGINNSEDFPMFSLSMSFKISFKNSIEKRNGSHETGDVISVRERPIQFQHINPKSTVEFYAIGFNQKYHITAVLPRSAQYTRGGDDTKLVATLRPASIAAMWFIPSQLMSGNATKN